MEQWIHCMESKRLRPTSPKTGEELCHLHLIPNHNLKRLLRDMLVEGRSDALYCKIEEDLGGEQDKQEGLTSTLPLSALIRENVLHLTCLGPTDSDWNKRSFQVTESEGCVGGRRKPQDIDAEKLKCMNYIHFTEVTISRKHFEIIYDNDRQEFCIRDLGSAGGTYVRMEPGKGLSIENGTMFMVGKHQLIAIRVPSVSSTNMNTSNDKNNDRSNNQTLTSNISDLDEREANTTKDIIEGDGSKQLIQQELSHVNVDLTDNMCLKDIIDALEIGSVQSEPDEYFDSKNGDDTSTESNNLNNRTDCESTNEISGDSCRLNLNDSLDCHANIISKPELVLRCFGPEGTPIQNKEFLVKDDIGTLGRKQTNCISFSHEVNGTHVGIDSSVSSEHAFVKYNKLSTKYELFDGNSDNKGSTNGTWVRLSKMHEESSLYPIKDGTELLFGTIRFKVHMDEQVVERDIIPS